jgi:peptide/nickel transport system substrate-binding protein
MVEHSSVQHLAQDLMAGRVSRRGFMKRAAALGLSASAISSVLSSPAATQAAAGGAAYTPELIAARAAAQVAEVPREETLVAVRSRQQGKFTDELIWNPFLPAGEHQLGSHMLYEPLSFYSAFEDKTTLWLAEGFEYSDDYMTLTVKTRPNVTWSDGEPFTAEDVAYTFNKLVEVGSKVKWGADVQQFLDTAEATDARAACVSGA